MKAHVNSQSRRAYHYLLMVRELRLFALDRYDHSSVTLTRQSRSGMMKTQAQDRWKEKTVGSGETLSMFYKEFRGRRV